MRLAVEIVGVEEAASGVTEGIARMQTRAFERMRSEMMDLRNYTVTAHLHGPTGSDTVKQRSGNLARSLVSQVEDDGALIEGVVGFPEGSTAPYARILDLGGTTRAHVIQAKKAKSLAFIVTDTGYGPEGLTSFGGMTYRRLVHHPGSNFPARPFLEHALDEKKAEIVEGLIAAIEGAS